MTTLVNLQTNRFIHSQLIALTGFKKGYSTVTAMQATLQPLDEQKTNLYNGAMGKTFKFFTDYNENVIEGDLFQEVDTGKRYKVVNGGVSRRSFGSMDFQNVIVIEVN